VYRTILVGYKLMPSYRNELNTRERWAAAAFVQRLQAAEPPPDAGVPAPVRPGPACAGEAP
jgi:hypothetical protein